MLMRPVKSLISRNASEVKLTADETYAVQTPSSLAKYHENKKGLAPTLTNFKYKYRKEQNLFDLLEDLANDTLSVLRI